MLHVVYIRLWHVRHENIRHMVAIGKLGVGISEWERNDWSSCKNSEIERYSYFVWYMDMK